MDAALRERVRSRAGNRCEYCKLRQEQEPLTFHVEHIVARQHGGLDESDNLALACQHCNFHKGTNLSGIDRETGKQVPLFHPRKDKWNKHFVREGAKIRGLTSTGRATISLLRMNHDGRLELRASRNA